MGIGCGAWYTLGNCSTIELQALIPYSNSLHWGRISLSSLTCPWTQATAQKSFEFAVFLPQPPESPEYRTCVPRLEVLCIRNFFWLFLWCQNYIFLSLFFLTHKEAWICTQSWSVGTFHQFNSAPSHRSRLNFLLLTSLEEAVRASWNYPTPATQSVPVCELLSGSRTLRLPSCVCYQTPVSVPHLCSLPHGHHVSSMWRPTIPPVQTRAVFWLEVAHGVAGDEALRLFTKAASDSGRWAPGSVEWATHRTGFSGMPTARWDFLLASRTLTLYSLAFALGVMETEPRASVSVPLLHWIYPVKTSGVFCPSRVGSSSMEELEIPFEHSSLNDHFILIVDQTMPLSRVAHTPPHNSFPTIFPHICPHDGLPCLCIHKSDKCPVGGGSGFAPHQGPCPWGFFPVLLWSRRWFLIRSLHLILLSFSL